MVGPAAGFGWSGRLGGRERARPRRADGAPKHDCVLPRAGPTRSGVYGEALSGAGWCAFLFCTFLLAGVGVRVFWLLRARAAGRVVTLSVVRILEDSSLIRGSIVWAFCTDLFFSVSAHIFWRVLCSAFEYRF